MFYKCVISDFMCVISVLLVCYECVISVITHNRYKLGPIDTKTESCIRCIRAHKIESLTNNRTSVAHSDNPMS